MEDARNSSLLLALGRVTANFSALELAVISSIWTLLGREDGRGQIITAEMSFKNLIHAYCSLFKHVIVDEDMLSELDALRKDLFAVEDRRNQYLHSVWAATDDPEQMARVKLAAKAKKGIEIKFEHVRAQQLEAFNDEIRGLMKRITQMLKKLRTLLGSDSA